MYEKVNWTSTTPINATNLNKMDNAIEQHFNEVESAINGIVESGSNENGSWIKWADGTMICRKTVSFGKVAITKTWGSFYESSSLNIGNYPIAFIETPDIILTSLYPNFVEKYGDESATSWGSFYASKPRSVESEDVKISAIAIGKWK